MSTSFYTGQAGASTAQVKHRTSPLNSILAFCTLRLQPQPEWLPLLLLLEALTVTTN